MDNALNNLDHERGEMIRQLKERISNLQDENNRNKR